jgi:hypothetical protein
VLAYYSARVVRLQQDLSQQRTITETVTEKNMWVTKDLEGIKKQLAELQTFVVPENLLIQLQLEKLHREYPGESNEPVDLRKKDGES